MAAATSNFALRMPPELKEAAKTLARVLFYEPHPSDDQCPVSVSFHSINDALGSMVVRGMEAALPFIEKEIEKLTEEVTFLQDILRFFMDNPVATRALAINFAEGSAARTFISEVDASYGEEEDFEPGVDRAFVADEFACCQGRLLKLGEVKGAILRARVAYREYRCAPLT